MVGSTLSATLTSEITLGTGIYLSPLTITKTAIIHAPAPTTSLQSASAIYVPAGIAGASIVNHGSVNGRLPTFDTLSVPALVADSALNLFNDGTIVGQSGIYLNAGGTITNSGLIAGSDARSTHDYGIRLINGSLINSGTVYGAKYGVTNWNLSEIDNSGAIQGNVAGVNLISTNPAYGGTLINDGSIYSQHTGITASQALITNTGNVTGETYGIRVAWGSTIANSGQITGGFEGVLLLNEQYQTADDSSLTNTGSIAGGYFGVAVNFSSTDNMAGGSITGQTFGVGVGQAGYFYNAGGVYGKNAGVLTENGGLAVNAGHIRGGTIGGYLLGGGNFTNAATGYIHGGTTGCRDDGGYLLNAGTIIGAGFGVYLMGGGIGVNSGKISASGEGIYLSSLSSTSSSDFFVNTGTVYGKTAGVIIKSGTLYNLGEISSPLIGVSMVSGTSLSNAGSIYGQKYGVQLTSAELTNAGTINGKKTGVEISHGYLLNSGTISGGTYAIYGQNFTLAVEAGENFAGKVVDKSSTSTLDLTGLAFGTLAGLGASITGFETINFINGSEWLISGNSAGLAHHEVINGFTFGDAILLTGFTMTGKVLSSTGIELFSGTNFVNLTIAVATTADYQFTVSSLGTEITYVLPCFTSDTRILTTRGKIPVQDLAVGEMLITLDAEESPIIWIGKRTVELRRHPHPETVQPICIAVNAFAENVPDQELSLSPDHAIYIDGYLIPAKELLNDCNITQASRERVTYYHIELEKHTVIFAENAAVETYLDTGNRFGFENGPTDIVPLPELGNAMRQQRSCAPILVSGEALNQIRTNIKMRAAQGFAASANAASR